MHKAEATRLSEPEYIVTKAHRPAMFVSSTCYDLSQVRADLYDFITSQGIEPIMSEFDTFPIDSSKNTVANCIEVVKARADIFLLIVGGRHGYVNSTGKSITNLEFLEARAKGVPKYVFVSRKVLDLLPIWKANPDADFSSAVESPKVFEFISEFRDSGEVWVCGFDTAQDIASAMRTQLSYLLSEGLDLRKKFHDMPIEFGTLKPQALRIAMEKPSGWEYLLFAQILNDEISALLQKRLDVELKISLGDTHAFDDPRELMTWVQRKIAALSHVTDSLTRMMNSGVAKAVGDPGVPGDVQRLNHVAKRMAEAYEEILDWTLEFYRIKTADSLKRLLELASDFSKNSINEIEEFSSTLYEKLQEAFVNASTYPKGTVIKFSLTLTAPDTQEFSVLLDRLEREFY